jgi:small subunit ribosomal protein S1
VSEESKSDEQKPRPEESVKSETKPSPKGTQKVRKVRDPSLARAFRSCRPVEGKVLGVIKGGYEVRVGRSRAFCPHSQIDVHRVENPEEHVGKSYYFRVHQYRRGGDDIVLSRRAFLEEEQADEAKAVRATLIEGSVMRGRVTGVVDFGAFVDLGAGVQGLVHISELSHTRVKKPSEAVSVGDVVSVRILALEGESGKISLSIRQAEADPWDEVAGEFEAGGTYPGTVNRIADFGAFVEMKPGIEALAPAREFRPSPGGWKEGLEPGTVKDWLVLSVEPGRRRMSVIPAAGAGDAAGVDLQEGALLKGTVQRIERFGIFVWLGPGKVGLVPAAWSGVPQGTRIDSRFKIAQEIEVQLVEVSARDGKIRLAMKGVEPDPSVVEPSSPGRRRNERRLDPGSDTAAPAAEQGTFGTSLGEALRAALGDKGGDSTDG